MPLLLDNRGVLPVGLHDATLTDIEGCFGKYNGREARCNLYKGLCRYIDAVKRTKWSCTLLIDGSFVMDKITEPEDIDAVFGYPAEIEPLIGTDELRPYQLNVIDKRYCQKEYKIDLKPCKVNSAEFSKWVDFFTEVSAKRAAEHGLPPGSKKGLVRVVL